MAHEERLPDPGDDQIERALAMAFAPTAPRPVAESVIAEIEAREGSGPFPDADGVAGRYRMFGEIGHGGIGVVFEGRDRDLARDVALKVLRSDRASSGDLVRRFIEEAQIAGQLEHPGVVPVYDLGVVQGGIPFFTMKLVRGWPLSDLLAEREDLSRDLPRFLGVFEQVCQTVAYAHSRGVIHRDLKPANVMVGAFGEVQLLDWGLSKVLDAAEPSADTGTRPITIRTADEGAASAAGMILGTPEYMAPEQARGQHDLLDERTDVFALGALLLEILTGSPAYSGDLKDILSKAVAADPVPIRERLAASAADPALSALCVCCLSRDISARPRTADDVAKAVSEYLSERLDRARRAEVAAAREQARAEAETAREAREGRRAAWARRSRRRAFAVAGAVLLAALIGGGTLIGLEVAGQRRRERVDSAVAGTLEEASRLEGQGRPEEALSRARAALDRARAGPAGPLLLDVASDAVARLERDVVEAQRAEEESAQVEALLAELKRLRVRSSWDFRLEPATVDADYVAAFRQFGVDLVDSTPEVIAAGIAGRSRSNEIVAALVGLAFNRRGLPGAREADWRPLLDAARIADPAPWSNRLLDAALAKERSALLELAATADIENLPARTVYLLGVHLALVQEHEAASNVFLRGKEAHPDDLWICRGAAQSIATLGAAGQRVAIGQAMAAVALCPEHGCYWSELGMQLGNAGDLEAAVRACRRSLELEPVHADHYARLGWPLLLMGRFAEAGSAYRSAIELDPARIPYRVNLASALLGQGKPEEALQVADDAASRAGAPFQAHVVRGRILEELGNFTAAEASFRKGISLHPDRGAIRRGLARLLRQTGRPTDAHEVLLRGVADIPQHAGLLVDLGDSHADREEFPQALDAYRRCAQRQRGGAGPLWVRLAWAFAITGETDKAARWYPRAAAWMAANRPEDDRLRRCMAEAKARLEGEDR